MIRRVGIWFFDSEDGAPVMPTRRQNPGKKAVTLSVRLDAQRREHLKGQKVPALRKSLLPPIIGVGIGT